MKTSKSSSQMDIEKLISAVIENDLQQVEDLLKNKKINPNANIQGSIFHTRPLFMAMRKDIAIARCLLAHNTNVNGTNTDLSTALHMAAEDGANDKLDLLLQYNAAVNPQDNKGNTPLHCAAINNHVYCVTRLLAKEANPEIPNIYEETPLDFARKYKCTEVIRILIQHPQCKTTIKSLL